MENNKETENVFKEKYEAIYSITDTRLAEMILEMILEKALKTLKSNSIVS